MADLRCYHGFLISLLFCAAMLVACGDDDDSDFATRPSGDSSLSSEKEIAASSSSLWRPLSSSSRNDNSSNSSSQKITWNHLNPNVDYGELVDNRDGQTYKTVKIGDQVWMAENLNFKTDSSFCYNDSARYCEQYGRLYNWAAAVGRSESECGSEKKCALPSGNIQGVCPSGWHLPDSTEFETLLDAVGGMPTAGMLLKSASGWDDFRDESGNGTDYFGFSALPVGDRGLFGEYANEGESARFWSSTEYERNGGVILIIDFGYDHAYVYISAKYNAFPVRCLQD